ncbi:phosphate ABC transporter substrate-binding protein [candidate division KSB1 bacterium]|nr:phosphate ABC transporter substrate-binding protein [candidate division KSB1 bacterium]
MTPIKSACFLSLLLLSCSRFQQAQPTIIRLKGSDTMQILGARWAESYMKLKPKVSVYVEGGGTATGVRALLDGEADVCTASRPLRAIEARLLAEKYGYLGIRHLVAKDALSIYVHPQNPVQNLTVEQLKHIFTGKINLWNQLGGNDDAIRVLIRSPNSGTYLYFKEHILDGEAYSPQAQTMTTTSAIVDAVANNPAAIGYGGIVYGSEVIHCKIENIAPTDATVRNDSYPIIRYLYLYTINTPRGQVKSFIDWVLTDGQKIVQQVGYIPLWEEN